jgi:hypothetical protein
MAHVAARHASAFSSVSTDLGQRESECRDGDGHLEGGAQARAWQPWEPDADDARLAGATSRRRLAHQPNRTMTGR